MLGQVVKTSPALGAEAASNSFRTQSSRSDSWQSAYRRLGARAVLLNELRLQGGVACALQLAITATLPSVWYSRFYSLDSRLTHIPVLTWAVGGLTALLGISGLVLLHSLLLGLHTTVSLVMGAGLGGYHTLVYVMMYDRCNRDQSTFRGCSAASSAASAVASAASAAASFLCACAATGSCTRTDLRSAACAGCQAWPTDVCAKIDRFLPYMGLVLLVSLCIPAVWSLRVAMRLEKSHSELAARVMYARALVLRELERLQSGGGLGLDPRALLQLMATLLRHGARRDAAPVREVCGALGLEPGALEVVWQDVEASSSSSGNNMAGVRTGAVTAAAAAAAAAAGGSSTTFEAGGPSSLPSRNSGLGGPTAAFHPTPSPSPPSPPPLSPPAGRAIAATAVIPVPINGAAGGPPMSIQPGPRPYGAASIAAVAARAAAAVAGVSRPDSPSAAAPATSQAGAARSWPQQQQPPPARTGTAFVRGPGLGPGPEPASASAAASASSTAATAATTPPGLPPPPGRAPEPPGRPAAATVPAAEGVGGSSSERQRSFIWQKLDMSSKTGPTPAGPGPGVPAAASTGAAAAQPAMLGRRGSGTILGAGAAAAPAPAANGWQVASGRPPGGTADVDGEVAGGQLAGPGGGGGETVRGAATRAHGSGSGSNFSSGTGSDSGSGSGSFDSRRTQVVPDAEARANELPDFGFWLGSGHGMGPRGIKTGSGSGSRFGSGGTGYGTAAAAAEAEAAAAALPGEVPEEVQLAVAKAAAVQKLEAGPVRTFKTPKSLQRARTRSQLI